MRSLALALGLIVALATPWTGAAAAGDNGYAAIVQRASTALGVSPVLVRAVIQAESRFEPGARSPAGALGLMQLMPASGARQAYRLLYGADGIPTDASLLRPDVNIWLGTAYLKYLDTRFNWIVDDASRLLAVIAAYNWGENRVLNRVLPERTQLNGQDFVARLWRRAPLETRQYVTRVVAALNAGTKTIAAR